MSAAKVLRVLGPACAVLAASLSAQAGDATPGPCFDDEVLLHVRAQFALYGPRSGQNEYFGFLYRKDGRVDSAVTYGHDCRGQSDCVVNTAFALARIPKGAKVLGEWHTHSRAGTRELSIDDVRGANSNRHIRCYSAFYSTPEGDIFRWDVAATSVTAAMASLVPAGNYHALAPVAGPKAGSSNGGKELRADTAADSAAIIAAPVSPGMTCLSTNTSVHTAATTTRCCRRSTTSR